MSSTMIRVQFQNRRLHEIPVADLKDVCAVGSKFVIRVPVASKETFDHFETYVNHFKLVAKNPGWDEWEDLFIEKFTDEEQLNYLAAVAGRTKQYTLKQLCNKRITDLMLIHEEEEDEDYDYNHDEDYDDYEDYEDYDYMESPPPDPEDEDIFWDNHGRGDDELYGEDRESPEP